MKKINSVKTELSSKFSVKELSKLSQFLGMNIERCGKIMTIDQEQYIDIIANILKLAYCNPVHTPIKKSLKLTKYDENTNCRSIDPLIGSLMYVTMETTPDVCFRVNNTSKFQSSPSSEHYTHSKRILKYIYHIKSLKLKYGQGKDTLMGVLMPTSQTNMKIENS